MTLFGKTLIAASLLLNSVAMANAAQWSVDESASKIEFEYLRAGSPTKGIFADFSGSGELDPANPDKARLSITIETTSIDLNDFLESAFATSAEWFDSKNNPHVTFQLTGLQSISENVFEAQGELTIRGETRPITTELRLVVGETTASARGEIEINRSDYLLGVGPSAAFMDIGPVVVVSFDLKAHPSQ